MIGVDISTNPWRLRKNSLQVFSISRLSPVPSGPRSRNPLRPPYISNDPQNKPPGFLSRGVASCGGFSCIASTGPASISARLTLLSLGFELRIWMVGSLAPVWSWYYRRQVLSLSFLQLPQQVFRG